MREKLSTGWCNDLLKELLLAEPVQVIQTPALPKKDAIEALTGIHERPRLRELHTHYRRIADRYMTENTFFYPDAVHVLQTLRARGAKLGIISSKNRPRKIQDRLVTVVSYSREKYRQFHTVTSNSANGTTAG